MSWTALSLFGTTLAAVAVLVVGLRWLRRYVCVRRKDCCGKGCGCLWPAPRR